MARLRSHADKIRDWLMPKEGYKPGLMLTKIHEILERQGVVVPYRSFHRLRSSTAASGANA